jgi:hypothetical protein
MDKNLKQASNSKSQKKEKAPTFRVQTDIRAGWVPGSIVRGGLRDLRASTDSSAEIR